jgi:NAD(P)-dependent dehydrogenase (short-subunit alcohol dehydrogenase family)
MVLERNADPLFDVTGRVVVVTGALGQLGRHFTRVLAERGARVAALDVQTDAGNAFVEMGGEVFYVRADVTDKASLKAALAAVTEHWETPFALINNAGIDATPGAPAGQNPRFEDFDESAWDAVLDVNLKGVFLCSQIFGGAMAAAGRGSIVNIGSIYGIISPDQRIYQYRRDRGETFFKPIAYAASKSGILNVTRYLATYWANANVRVNTLTFAGVFNNQDAEFLKEYTARVPLGRMAEPDDYAGAIVFLCADASSYVTGANWVIDGGFTAW